MARIKQVSCALDAQKNTLLTSNSNQKPKGKFHSLPHISDPKSAQNEQFWGSENPFILICLNARHNWLKKSNFSRIFYISYLKIWIIFRIGNWFLSSQNTITQHTMFAWKLRHVWFKKIFCPRKASELGEIIYRHPWENKFPGSLAFLQEKYFLKQTCPHFHTNEVCWVIQFWKEENFSQM